MADKTNVDTSKFRRAIWNYIQCIYGIRHDDYDYGEVNQVSFDWFLIRFKRSEHKMFPEIMRTSTLLWIYLSLGTIGNSVHQCSQSRLFRDFLKKKIVPDFENSLDIDVLDQLEQNLFGGWDLVVWVPGNVGLKRQYSNYLHNLRRKKIPFKSWLSIELRTLLGNS